MPMARSHAGSFDNPHDSFGRCLPNWSRRSPWRSRDRWRRRRDRLSRGLARLHYGYRRGFRSPPTSLGRPGGPVRKLRHAARANWFATRRVYVSSTLSRAASILGRGVPAMTDLVVVPRVRRLLSERRLALDEFHRRLVARGDAPSRAALGRLAQERPIRVIRMETGLPILEELAVPFGTLFESLPCAEWERRELANGQARAVATTLVDRNGRRSPLSADKE